MFGGFAFVSVIRGSRVFRVQGVARQFGLTLRDCELSFVLGRQLFRREAQFAGRVGGLAAHAEGVTNFDGSRACVSGQ
eukprot:1559242-Pleurochrysis_carterae.AAC.1